MKNKLLSIVLTAISISLCFSAYCQKNQERKVEKKDIYLQLYSVRDDINKDYSSTIKKVAEIGFTGIEAAGYSDGKFYGLSPKAFQKSIEDNGMTVLSSHTRNILDEDISKTNWSEIWNWWDRAIQAHKDAGMKYIVFSSMPEPTTLKDLDAYCDYFNKIGEKCNAAGIEFGYHNHNFEFNEIEGVTIYDYLLTHTDSTKVFFEMDVYWVIKGGKSPVYYFKKYPGKFPLQHIKDQTQLGESGTVGFDAIFNNAESAGLKYPIVEIEWYDYEPLKSVEISYKYLVNSPFVRASYTK